MKLNMIYLYEVLKEVKPLSGNRNQNSDHVWSGVGGRGSSRKGHKGALWGECSTHLGTLVNVIVTTHPTQCL